MSRFFIHRPVFAGVIAIVIVLAGLVAAKLLAVAQYPEIAPPTVLITTSYPGASAETLTKTVAAPIEEQLSGLKRLSYFSSTASSTGALSITITFEPGSNADPAGVTVNNPVNIALPRPPAEVRRNRITPHKRSLYILHAATRHRAHRAGRAQLRHLQHDRRPAGDRHGDLPAAGRQRA